MVPGEDESLEEIWIGFAMPPLAGVCEVPPQPEWIQVVLAAIIPEAGLENVEFGGSFPRAGGSRPNEILLALVLNALPAGVRSFAIVQAWRARQDSPKLRLEPPSPTGSCARAGTTARGRAHEATRCTPVVLNDALGVRRVRERRSSNCA